MKYYLGVSSLDGGGVFYFNLNNVSFIRMTHVHTESKAWKTYIEYCEQRDMKPCDKAYFLVLGTNVRKKESFLISNRKRLRIIERMKDHLCADLVEEEE